MLLVNQKETILDVRYGSCPAVPKYVNPECFKSILQFSDFCTVLWALAQRLDFSKNLIDYKVNFLFYPDMEQKKKLRW